MKLRRAAAILAVLLAGTGIAAAQTPNTQIAYGSIAKAPVGAWADYIMSKDGEAQTVRVRYTLVKRDAKQIALEMDSATPMGRMLMRLEFAPRGDAHWKLDKAKIKMGDNPARDIALPEGAMSGFGKDDSFGDKLAHEDIAVKGGRFSTDHYRRKVEQWTTDVWIDDKVLPMGMVRLVDGEGGRIELIGTGKDGKSGF
jgi:hypothetical protein